MGKWGFKDISTDTCKIALFISRNKDNKDVENFKQRRSSFLVSMDSSINLQDEFLRFVNNGVKGETSRFYISVNPRDLDKVKKGLLHKLIDDEDNRMIVNPLPYIAGIAALMENRADRKWLIDIDTKDEEVVKEVKEIIEEQDVMITNTIETPNGYHLITERGFDSRKLMDIHGDVVEIKKDDMKFVDQKKKE